MKKNIFLNLFGILGPVIFIIGMLFWIQHWQYAKEIRILGFLMFSIFWIWILINVLKSTLSGIQKVIWIIFILFVPLFSSWAYYFIFREKNKAVNTLDGDLLLSDENN